MIKLFQYMLPVSKNGFIPFLYTLMATGMLSIIVASCQPDNQVNTQEDGLPAVIRLEVTGEEQVDATTRAVNEDKINDLHILVYDNKGKLIGQQYNTGSSVTVKTHSAKGCAIYAVANTGKPNLFNGNNDVYLESQLKKAVFSLSTWDELNKGTHLPMTGSISKVDIAAGTQTVTGGIKVSRMAAKVTLNIGVATHSNSNITITDYTIHHLPRNSYYIPHPLSTESGIIDSNTFPGEDAMDATNDAHWANSPQTTVNSTTVSTTFYMFENRRGVINSITKQNNKNNANAPERSTYVDINGTIDDVKANWKIYLGANNTSNFNIKRNCQYKYTITLEITGKADTRISIDIKNIINLSNDGLANCYLSSIDNQWYEFDATIRGNGQITDYAAQQYKGLSLMPSTISSADNAVKIPATQIQDAVVVWETAKGLINWIIWDVNSGYIKFKTGTQKGNALIAVRDIDKNILWSWHIWRTNNVDLATLNNSHVTNIQTNTKRSWYNGTNAGVRNIKLMDRNLGAAFDGSLDFPDCIGNNGLQYQFGRKDPFPSGTIYKTESGINYGDILLYGHGSNDTENSFTILSKTEKAKSDKNAKETIDYTILHPEVFLTNSYNWIYNAQTTGSNDWKISNCLWGDNNNSNTNSMDVIPWDGGKTIYDPCPAGWRIAPVDTWTGLLKDSATSWTATISNLYTTGSWSGGAPWGLTFYETPSSNYFPALGYRDCTNAYLCNAGNNGYYWYSSPSGGSDLRASYMQFYTSEVYLSQSTSRAYGFSIRCIKE